MQGSHQIRVSPVEKEYVKYKYEDSVSLWNIDNNHLCFVAWWLLSIFQSETLSSYLCFTYSFYRTYSDLMTPLHTLFLLCFLIIWICDSAWLTLPFSLILTFSHICRTTVTARFHFWMIILSYVAFYFYFHFIILLSADCWWWNST